MNRPTRLSVLIVDPDVERAHALSIHLKREIGVLDVHHLIAPAEADVCLKTAHFDAVVAYHVPEVASWVRQMASPEITVIVVGEDPLDRDWGEAVEYYVQEGTANATFRLLAQALRRRWQPLLYDGKAHGSESSPSNGAVHPEAVLKAVDAAASGLKHDINNPLSIIAGNAQLLLELATAHQLDDDVVQAVRDIESAAEQASKLVGQLKHLRKHVARNVVDASASDYWRRASS